MPLPDAEPTPDKSNVYEQLRTIKASDLTRTQLDVVRDPLFLDAASEDVLRRILLIGSVTDQLSLSGPIPRTLKLFTFRYTGTGNNYESLDIGVGEVWAFNTLSIAEGGSGTATVSFALYDGTDQSFFAVHSTTSQEPVPVSADSMGSPIYITSDFKLNNLVNATGGTHVDVDLTLIRIR